MNSTQMACLQKLINTLQECEGNGLTFSPTCLRLDVEDNESHYLSYLSAQKLFELFEFIGGCGVFKPEPLEFSANNVTTPKSKTDLQGYIQELEEIINSLKTQLMDKFCSGDEWMYTEELEVYIKKLTFLGEIK